MSEGQSSSMTPIAQRDNTKLGMWVFLGGEVVFFISLILTFVLTRLIHTGYQAEFRSHLSIPLIAVNTFVLVASSYFVVRSLEAIDFKSSSKEMRNNLILVFVLGLLFLGGQAFEWITLFNEGINLTSTYGSSFFTVTGIHGTHVFIGILWAIYILAYNWRRPFQREEHLVVENFGLYWHFVDIVWIVLFTVIYLL
jgi:heme/copper-type cytochrome/quinol oxidase subunit 3